MAVKTIMRGEEIIITDVWCEHCNKGEMSQIGTINLPIAHNERTGHGVTDHQLRAGRNATMMKCQHCGYIVLFDLNTVERNLPTA